MRYSQALKPTHSHHTNPTTSKFPWRKGQSLFMDQYTPYHHWNWQLFEKGAYTEWLHLPHQVSMGSSSSLCKKEGWEPPPMCRFPCTQQSHGERLLPTSAHHGPAQCPWACQDILENQLETHIPPCTHCRGG